MLEGFGEDADDLRYAIWTSRERHGPRSTCGRPCGRRHTEGEQELDIFDETTRE